MTFSLTSDKSLLTLSSPNGKEITIFASRKISNDEINSASLNEIPSWEPALRELVKIEKIDSGWKIIINGEKTWRKWLIKLDPRSIIFPTREGEYISNLNKIKNFETYSLSYPGTASSKSVVANIDENSGFVICSQPSLDWAKISLTRHQNSYLLQFFQNDGELYIFPFTKGWKEGINKIRDVFAHTIIKKPTNKILAEPRFMLQMGLIDFFGKKYIKHFNDLMPFITSYHNVVGPGNLVHFFATNTAGFDTMFPIYSIDKSLGGSVGLKTLNQKVHTLGLYTSHHFNPRIADSYWLKDHTEFREAVITNPAGNPWVEFYKNSIFYVMNPSNKRWQELCLDKIQYFKKIGFDYVELDQIAYQRNLYTQENGFGKGYQELIDLTHRIGMKYWIEGVSDIFKIHSDCFFQVLPRDRYQLWETSENRRGYVFGAPFTAFYKTLMPNVPTSYQIVTEKAKIGLITKRLRLAKELNSQIYDLELGFVDKTYKSKLDNTLGKISKFLKEKNGQ
jgi:hypothetical protein